MAFEKIKDQTEQIQEHIKGYIETGVAYYKLRAFKILMKSTTTIVKYFFILLCLTMSVLFGSIAGAFALGVYLDNIALGFLIVSGIYLLVAAVMILIKSKIITSFILKKFSAIFFND